jgi:hypothetical protein
MSFVCLDKEPPNGGEGGTGVVGKVFDERQGGPRQVAASFFA